MMNPHRAQNKVQSYKKYSNTKHDSRLVLGQSVVPELGKEQLILASLFQAIFEPQDCIYET